MAVRLVCGSISHTQCHIVVQGIKMYKYFICVLYLIYVFDQMYTHKPQEYGKFKLKILRLNLCKGPKRLDCCNISANVVNYTHLDYKIDIVKTNIPNRGKISVTMNKQPLLRLQMKKPCDHLYMKGLFQTILNATQRCEFQKGKYHIDIDIDDVANTYYGGEFLYGNMTFKAVFYNDECNFSCTEIDVNFSPAPVNEKNKH